MISFCFVWNDEKKILATKLNESRETTNFDFDENLFVTAQPFTDPLPMPCIQNTNILNLISHKCWMLRCRTQRNDGKRPTMPMLLRSFGWHHYWKRRYSFFFVPLRIFRIALSEWDRRERESMSDSIVLYCAGACCWCWCWNLLMYFNSKNNHVLAFHLFTGCSNIFARQFYSGANQE